MPDVNANTDPNMIQSAPTPVLPFPEMKKTRKRKDPNAEVDPKRRIKELETKLADANERNEILGNKYEAITKELDLINKSTNNRKMYNRAALQNIQEQLGALQHTVQIMLAGGDL